MDENAAPAPVWPPVRARKQVSGIARAATGTLATTPARPSPSLIIGSLLPSPAPRTPLTPTPTNTSKKPPEYRNGYEVKPQTPSHKPYALNSRGQKRLRAFAFDDDEAIQIRPRLPKSTAAWNELAWEKGLLPAGIELRQFQVDSTVLSVVCVAL
ncbi:hypothetical protein HWV62_4900 [Athelia sp. TMB]|nr:hypothetical protein HWV62_4900 [Athelia sp. TMB]